MARSFGGKYSPNPQTPADAGLSLPVRHRLASRPKWVTIASVPLLFTAFGQDAVGLVGHLAGFGLIASAMWITGEGLRAEAAYRTRRVARRPAIPRKLFGAVIAGAGLGLGAAEPGALAGAGLIGVAGTVLHLLAFGMDPMRDKGRGNGDDFQQDRAQRMIEEGQAMLTAMQEAVARTHDRTLQSRVAAFAATVQGLFDRVLDNPGDLGAARRYLGVYLQGARDATVKFADLDARRPDPATRKAYTTFLDDLERDFNAKIAKLLEGDRADLDIEISVLRDRLAREGVRATESPATDQPGPARLMSDSASTLDDLLGDGSRDIPNVRSGKE